MAEINRGKTVQGLAWSFFERISQQGIQFLISIVLARLLVPAEFGLIAMLMIFISLAQAILDSGFGSALIRKQNATRLDESSVFYFNIVFGVVVALLFYATAPAIAGFYETPQLAQVIRWMSIVLVINSFGVVQTALLTKRVDFKTQMKASTISTVLSGGIAIVLALKGAGVWCLVVQSITGNLIRTILLWILSDWRPLFAFSKASLLEMFPFGSRILVTSMINTVFNNIYYLFIGKLFTPTDLGYYSRAQSTQQLPVQHILTSTVARVVYPVFASLQDDLVRLKSALRRSLSAMAFVTFPVMVGLALVAKPMVLVILTEKWLPSVEYLQLLCVVGLFFPLQQICLNSIKAQGRSDLYFRIEALTKILILGVIAVTYRWGILVMIYGQIVTAGIAYLITAVHLKGLLRYNLAEHGKDLLPALTASIVMGGSVFVTGRYLPVGNVLLLVSQITIGAVVYGLLSHYFRLSSYMEFRQLIKDRVRIGISDTVDSPTDLV